MILRGKPAGNLPVSKKECREIIRAARKRRAPEEKLLAEKAMAGRILGLFAFEKAESVMLYWPLAGEPNLLAVAEKALTMGKTVYFPRTNPDFSLSAVPVASLTGFQEGKFGVREPQGPAANPADIHFLLIPMLGFNRGLARLGQGAGCYDRFLPAARGLRVGVSYEEERLNFLAAPHDAVMDIIVTQKKIYAKEGALHGMGYN